MLVFNIFPIYGIFLPNPDQLRFSRKSLRYIVCTFIMFFGIFETVLSLRLTHKLGADIKAISDIISWMVVLYTCSEFLKLAMRWPKLMRVICKTEEIFLRFPYQAPKRSITVLMTSVAMLTLIIIIGEYFCLKIQKIRSIFH